MMTFSELQTWWLKGQFRMLARFEFYNMLIILLENQVMLGTALPSMYDIFSDSGRRTRNILALVCQDCAMGMAGGKPFSEALGKWIGYDEYSMIRAGELAGNLPLAMRKAMRLIGKKKEIGKAAATALLYPTVLLLQASYLLQKVAQDLVPKFSRASNPEAWNAPAAALKAIAEFVIRYGAASAIVLLVTAVCVLVSLPYLRGRIRFYLDKVPPWSIYRMVYGGPFLQITGVLMASGVRLPVALEGMLQRATPWLGQRIEDTLHGVNIGCNLGTALYQAGHDFPDKRAIQLLRIISGMEGSDEQIEKFGERWMDESVERLKQAAVLLLGCAIALNGALMLLVLTGASGMSDAMIQGMSR